MDETRAGEGVKAGERGATASTDIMEKLRAEVLKHVNLAEWYHHQLAENMSERERLRHRACLDVIEIVERYGQDAGAEIERQRYCQYNDFKYLQSEGFEHLAEEIVVRYQIFGELVMCMKDFISF